jgi:hypothetical protein
MNLFAKALKLSFGVLVIALEFGHVAAQRLEGFVHEFVRDLGHDL